MLKGYWQKAHWLKLKVRLKGRGRRTRTPKVRTALSRPCSDRQRASFFFGSRAVQSADACLKEASDPSNIGKVIFSIPDRFRGGYKVFERVPTRGRTIRLE